MGKSRHAHPPVLPPVGNSRSLSSRRKARVIRVRKGKLYRDPVQPAATLSR